MYLAWAIKYAVQDAWARIVPTVWLLLLTGLGATESGMNGSVIGVITTASAFVSVALELAGAVFGLGGAYFVGCVGTASQPNILSHTKVCHKCREGCHGSRLFLAKVAGKPFVLDAMIKGR